MEHLKTGNKVILFSQWDEMLHKVGCKLQEFDLNFVYCKGSVYNRKQAIERFKNDANVQIIMLSSRNCASGINLTNASSIILLEPVYGTNEYRKSIEEQSIGRSDRIGQNKPIDIYRFIIKDTIEEDIINQNIDDSKFKQLC
jgi:SNF2 family DNA or RNA helicase